jgi:succinate dehydrogenase / fumarate reductase flavoprotein subunit
MPASPDPGEVETASRDMLSYFERQDGESPYAIHRDLEQTMQDLVGIFRNAEDLAKGIEKVGELSERTGRTRVEGSRLFNPGWHLARDLQSMLTVSEAVARSALARQESRGAHSRTDFPKPDPEWGRRNIVARRTKSGMELSERPVPEPPPELRTLLEEAT